MVQAQDLPDWGSNSFPSLNSLSVFNTYKLIGGIRLNIIQGIPNVYILVTSVTFACTDSSGGQVTLSYSSGTGSIFSYEKNGLRTMQLPFFGRKIPLGDGLDIVTDAVAAMTKADTVLINYLLSSS